MQFTSFDLRTGTHKHLIGTTWKAQDGPGPSWTESVAPRRCRNGRLEWRIIGQNGWLTKQQIEAIADVISDAIDALDRPTNEQAIEAALDAICAAGLDDLVRKETAR